MAQSLSKDAIQIILLQKESKKEQSLSKESIQIKFFQKESKKEL